MTTAGKKPRTDKSKHKGPVARPGVVLPFPSIRRRSPALPTRLFRCTFRNGLTIGAPVIEKDIKRLWSVVQELDTFHAFLVFDSAERRIGINLRHVVLAQFDGNQETPVYGRALPTAPVVEVLFAAAADPISFKVAPDTLRILDSDEYGGDDFEDRIRIADLFHYCEASHTGSDYSVNIHDLAGSSIWLRLNDVALVSAPLTHIVPD